MWLIFLRPVLLKINWRRIVAVWQCAYFFLSLWFCVHVFLGVSFCVILLILLCEYQSMWVLDILALAVVLETRACLDLLE